MPETISCYRCGESLEKLSLPFSHRDECPACTVHVHVCRMCIYFDRQAPRQCTEDGADDVTDKEKINFCDWFKPSSNAFDAVRAGQQVRARNELDSLFGGEAADQTEADPATQSAEDLFK